MNLERNARFRLRNFRQATLLAIAVTGLILMVWGIGETDGAEIDNNLPGQAQVHDASSTSPAGANADLQEDFAGNQVFDADQPATAEEMRPIYPGDPVESLHGAAATVRDLLLGFYQVLPRLLVAVLLILMAGGVASLVRLVLSYALRDWQRRDAITAIVRLVLYLVAIGAALSVIAGDARALVGSVGLAGLALSWALQTPIESFTGWVLNALRSYYKVGDRIEVGEVFGDVYKIDLLTTTVWEAGGPGKSVQAAQATGAMITFPNWEVLRSNIINYSRDFPYVWDEVTLNVAPDSDLRYTSDVLQRAAAEKLGDSMTQPTDKYRSLLQRARMAFDIAAEPAVFVTLADTWVNFTVRYLVPVRERRRWATALLLTITHEVNKPEHAGRIIPYYPRREIRIKDWQEQATAEHANDQ